MKLKKKLIRWLSLRLPTCKEVTRMASEAMERRLPLRQRLNIKLHLLFCALCMRYVRQLQFMRAAVQQHAAQIEDRAAPPDARLSAEARARLKRSLRA